MGSEVQEDTLEDLKYTQAIKQGLHGYLSGDKLLLSVPSFQERLDHFRCVVAQFVPKVKGSYLFGKSFMLCGILFHDLIFMLCLGEMSHRRD